MAKRKLTKAERKRRARMLNGQPSIDELVAMLRVVIPMVKPTNKEQAALLKRFSAIVDDEKWEASSLRVARG